MDIFIAEQVFNFNDASEVRVESGGYDLYIEEPGYDKSSETMIHQFTSKSILIPRHIEARVRRCSVLPCSKVYIDKSERKRLYTYFD